MARAPALPIDPHLPEVVAAVRRHRALVLTAEPGAGKTTRVPPALLDAGLLGDGRLWLLEPRRLAARAAAARIAAERGTPLGGEVGYRVRFERRDGPRTRLLAVTEGLLVRRLQDDPFLEGIAAIVFDEVHERSLDLDLALAMTLEVRREARPDLIVVAMSATLEAGPLAERLQAPAIAVPGRAHPVTVEWLARPDQRPVWGRVAAGVRSELAAGEGGVLAFLPGRGEIERAGELLADLGAGFEVVPLHGSLDLAAQQRALAPAAGRKVVLATNVAETSLTVPGVRSVVDGGLVKTLRFDAGVGLDRLETGRVSRASADQRTGRAGREAPGRCLRLWTAAEDRGLLGFELPEIRRVDLSGLLLQLLAWGVADVATLPWLDAPDPERLAAGRELLRLLGAIDGSGVTRLGQAMAALPLSPRLARLVLAGDELGCRRDAALAAALLAEGDPFRRRGDEAPAATGDSDLDPRVEALRRGRGGARARRVVQAAAQIERLTGSSSDGVQQVPGSLSHALLDAYPDRVARRREPGSDRALMVGGRGLWLAPSSGVRQAELFVAVEVGAGRRGERSEGVVRLAAAIEREWLPAAGLRREVELEIHAAGRVAAVERERYLDLVLAERPVALDPAAREGALAAAAAPDLAGALGLDRPEVASLLARVDFLRREMPELELPATGEDALLALLPLLVAGRRSLAELRRAPVADTLLGTLTLTQRRALERDAPERVEVPSGNRPRLVWEEGRPPVLPVRIQELFGLAETPRLAGGRVPVLLHLLAPNGRPQQVTDDLAGFWRRVYPQVRKELRGRYPKHAWPEDPLAAAPERRPRRPRRG